MTKAYDHNARKYWILNVGDLKPAEIDIDYFMQLAWNEPNTAKLSQREWLTQWFTEQFPAVNASSIADVITRYYNLNFIRKPEFMGFNGYNDGINRTSFNTMAWDFGTVTAIPDAQTGPITTYRATSNVYSSQSGGREAAWAWLRDDELAIAKTLSPQYAAAFFELVGYPVEAAAAMNLKFLLTDSTYLLAHQHNDYALASQVRNAQDFFDSIQPLTARYNSLQNGKWDGIMSAAPRDRHVFEMPRTATDADANTPLPVSWGAGDASCQSSTNPSVQSPNANQPSIFVEELCTVSINAAHFTRKSDGMPTRWNILADLGISGASVVYGSPGLLANTDIAIATSGPQATPTLDYDFTTTTSGPATLALHLLPTFPIDSDHKLRYAVSIDGAAPVELDAAASAPMASVGAGDGPANSGWGENVLRNSAIATIPLGTLAAGKHTLRLISRDPGVVYEHLVITFPGAPPAYPVPPETR
jgi:hypothetical protein